MFGFSSDGGSFHDVATSLCEAFGSEGGALDFSWDGDFDFDNASYDLIADFIDRTATESSPYKAIACCLDNIGPDRSDNKNALFVSRAFTLHKKLDDPAKRATVLERLLPHAHLMENSDPLWSDKALNEWNTNIRQMADKEAALERAKAMVGFGYTINKTPVMKVEDNKIRKAASLAILDSIEGIKGENPTRQMLDMMIIPPDGSSYYHDMLNKAADFLHKVEDKNELVGLALNILTMDEHGKAAHRSALAIAENVDAIKNPTRQLALLKTAARVFAPKSETEIRIANKWAEKAVTLCARGIVDMETVLKDITQEFPSESHLKEQADMMAASLASVWLKSDYVSEREKGFALARDTMKLAVQDTPKSMVSRLVLYNSEILSSLKDQAALAFETLQCNKAETPESDQAVEVLLDNIGILTNTNRYAADAASENDLRLTYAYEGARKVTEGSDLEIAIVGQWMEAWESLPNQGEKIGHLIQILQENKDAGRDRLIYTVAWEKYDSLRNNVMQSSSKAPAHEKRETYPSTTLN